jgi:hypothetical protein
VTDFVTNRSKNYISVQLFMRLIRRNFSINRVNRVTYEFEKGVRDTGFEEVRLNWHSSVGQGFGHYQFWPVTRCGGVLTHFMDF